MIVIYAMSDFGRSFAKPRMVSLKKTQNTRGIWDESAQAQRLETKLLISQLTKQITVGTRYFELAGDREISSK